MKKKIWQLIIKAGCYPNIYFTRNPFKILEFKEITQGITWRGNERVLDIGCGLGNQTLLLAQKCGYITGIEINSEFITTARWFAEQVGNKVNVDFEHRRLEEIHFPSDSFDFIFSICVLEHIPDHESIIQEVKRILKPGGRLLLSVDSLAAINSQRLVDIHKKKHSVQKYYNIEELKNLLKEMGFADVDVYPIFQSRMAVDLFQQGILQGFHFSLPQVFCLSRRLIQAEAKVSNPTPGIFLIAKAKKALL